MKVLVTGGAGFLGSRIVERLVARGDDVRVFARSENKSLRERGVTPIRGDLRDAEKVSAAVAGTDAVFHVAARAGVWGRRSEFFAINLDGTRNVLAACQQHEVPRLVYTSTPSVVFGQLPLEGADEETPCPKSYLAAYPESKARAEAEVLAADSLGGLRTTALRPHLIWGPGDPHLVPRILERAKRGKLKRVGDGSNRVDITHVEDAADAHLLALEALAGDAVAGGRVYFISSETVVLWDWIDSLLRKAGLPNVTRSVSRGTAYRAGAVMEFLYGLLGLSTEPPMTRFVAQSLATSHWFDISRARRELGYEPSRFGDRALNQLFDQAEILAAETGGANG